MFQRLCPACKTSVEDEFHILVECQHYDEERLPLITAAQTNFEDFNEMSILVKYCTILSSDILQTTLAKTLVKIMAKQRTFLDL